MSIVRMAGDNPSRLTISERIVNCTHLKLTRLYDEFGCNKCSICQKGPSLGWLYRCTQDSDGCLPSSDFSNVEDNKRYNQDAQLYTLSPSIIEAAQQGHYTDDELDILWKQKLGVRRAIQQIRPTTSSTTTSVDSSQYSLPASTTTSTVPSSNFEMDPDFEVSQTLEQILPCRSPLQPIQEVHDDLENGHRIIPSVKTRPPSPCNFKVYQTCRPVYRERAWQSIDGIVRTSYMLLPRHEIENRRISDLNVVKNLGLTGSYKTSTSQHHHFRNSKGGRRLDFQETVQKLLKKQKSTTDTERYTLRHTEAYSNLAALANANLSVTSVSSTSETNGPPCFPFGRTNNSSFSPHRPLFARRGFERLTTIQTPPRLAVSLSGDSSSSSALSTEQSNTSSPAILDLRIDPAKANAKQGNAAPPQKTPTESLKESLKRFGIAGKPQLRFPID